MAKTFCVPEVGSQQRTDHGSGIDGSVEPGEIVAQLSLLLWQLELLSSKGATQGLMPPVPIAMRNKPMNETALVKKSIIKIGFPDC